VKSISRHGVCSAGLFPNGRDNEAPAARRAFGACRHRLLAAAILAVSIAAPWLAAPAAHATTYTWTKNSAVTQTWTTAANWDANGVYAGGATDELRFFADNTIVLAAGTNNISTNAPATLTTNILTLNGTGAASGMTSQVSVDSLSTTRTWTLDGANPTVNLNGMNGGVALWYNIMPKIVLAQSNTLFTGNGTAGTFNFYGVISGATSAITKEGSSTLRLVSYDGANTFGGGLTVKAGTVQWASNAGALGSGTVTLGYNGGSGTDSVSLVYTNVKSASPVAPNLIVLDPNYAGTITIGHAGTGTGGYSGGVTGAHDLTVANTNTGTLSFSGASINNTGALTFTGNSSGPTTITSGIGSNVTTVTKEGTGTLTFNGTNACTGGIVVNQGRFNAASGTLGATTNTLQVNNTNTGAGTGVILDLPNGADTTVGSLSGAIATPSSGANTATIQFNGGAARTFTVNQTADGAYAGVILGDKLSFVLGSGSTNTLTFGGANTYYGTTTISAGTLSLGNSLALQNSALDTAGSIDGNSTVGLKTTVTALTFGGLTGDKDLASVFTTAPGGPEGATALGGYSGVTALTLNPKTGVSNSYSGIIADGAAGMALTKTGAGTQTLGGNNTYTGNTTVSAGTLIFSGANTGTGNILVSAGTLQFAKRVSLYDANTANWTAAKINVKSGATLALNVDSAGTAGFDGASLDTLLTNISVASTATEGLQSGANLAFDTSTATAGEFTQGNPIADSTGANGGAISVTKLGAGTLVLDKNNTYTGPTTVNAGTLVLSGSNSTSGTTLGAATISLGNDGALGAGTFTIAKEGTVVAEGTVVTNNPVAANSNFAIDGDGALTLGDMTVSASPITITNRNTKGTTTFGAISGADRNLKFYGDGSTKVTGIIATGSGYLVKDGAGTLTLTNTANTYTKPTYVYGGTLSFNSIANVGGGASSLGAPTTIANGTIAVGTTSTIVGAGLMYTGDGHSSDRVINLGGTSGGCTIDAAGTGALVMTSAMTATGVGSKTLTLTGSSTANNTIGGAIVNNSTTGSTTLGATFAIGATTVVLNSVDGVSVGASISGTGIAAGTTVIDIDTGAKTVTLSTPATAASGTLNSTYTVAGVQNLTSLAKTGAGTWVLSGASTYTGATTVSNGTLLVNSPGSLSAASAVTIKSGGTLGGDGTIGGAVAVDSGGVLAPGAGAGTLKAGTIVTMAAGSIYNWQFNSPTAVDKVEITGSLELDTGWKLSLGGLGTPENGTEYDIFTYTAGFTGDIGGSIIFTPAGWPIVQIKQDQTSTPMRIYLSFGLSGDTNRDGAVDAADFITVKKNFGAGVGGAGAAAGDFDKTGTVNWADLGILMSNMGAGGGAPATAPEPCSAMLLMFGAAAMLRRRK
jgi:autotransporter-associated beta strand protein